MTTTAETTLTTQTTGTFSGAGTPTFGSLAAQIPYQREIKAPPFSQEKPALWFAQLEAQFRSYGITTEVDKYYKVIPLIDTRSAAEVESIIINMPTDNPYQKLKNELIACFSKSRESNLLQLLDKENIGDRSPSQYLRYLKSLVPDIDEEVLKARWLSHLPEQTKACLIVQEKAPLDDLGKLADKLHEVYTPRSVATITRPESESEIAQLTSKITQLTATVAAIQLDVARPHRRRSLSRNRPRNRSTSRPSSSMGESQTCWYHNKFGNKARKCEEGCKFQGNANESR